ncbi:MAG: ATP-binding cassette domain-containing protein [Bacteroidales bacterium]
MLKIEELKADYGTLNVLNNLSLKIETGTIHGLVGLNGSGKTTLLNTIYGIKKKAKGTILYNDIQINRHQMAYLETVNYFYPRITGYEYLQICSFNNKNFDINKWNALFELSLEKLIDEYSTGMKKKLAFIAILALNREILILDEPFNGIDLETVQKVKMLLQQLKPDKTILVTSHILESLTGICDHISYLNNGKIQFTKDNAEFDTIENEIFAVHHEKISKQIKDLVGGH